MSGIPKAVLILTGGGGAESFTDLDDVPSAYTGHGLKLVRVKATADGLEFVTSDGVSSFVDLDDVPVAYTGQSGKVLAVKGTEDGLEFVSPGSGSGGKAAPTYTIYVSGGTTYVLNDMGTTVYSNADEATAIQYAINQLTSPGSIFIKRGTYTIDTTLVDNGIDGITIEGENDATILKAKNSLDNRVILLTDVDDWVLKNFKIDGNAANQAAPSGTFPNGIEVQLGARVRVENITAYNCRMYGIWFRTGTFHSADKCRVINDPNYGCWNGIFLGADYANGGPLGDFFTVSNCYVEGSADIGIAVGTSYFTVENCYVYNCINKGGSANPANTTGQSFKVEAGEYGVVRDVFCYLSQKSMMSINHADHVDFINCWCIEWEQGGGGDMGTYTNTITHIRWINCRYICDNGSGIQLETNCDYNDVIDCKFQIPNNTALLISNSNCDHNFVDGCNFQGCGTDVSNSGTNTKWGTNKDSAGNLDVGVEP